MKLNTDTRVDPAQLADELSKSLGRQIAVSVRQPTDEDQGAVLVLDAETGEPLDDKVVDAKAVRKALRDHSPKPRERQPSSDERLVAALQTAQSLEDVKAALIARFTPAERPERPERRQAR